MAVGPGGGYNPPGGQGGAPAGQPANFPPPPASPPSVNSPDKGPGLLSKALRTVFYPVAHPIKTAQWIAGTTIVCSIVVGGVQTVNELSPSGNVVSSEFAPLFLEHSWDNAKTAFSYEWKLAGKAASEVYDAAQSGAAMVGAPSLPAKEKVTPGDRTVAESFMPRAYAHICIDKAEMAAFLSPAGSAEKAYIQTRLNEIEQGQISYELKYQDTGFYGNNPGKVGVIWIPSMPEGFDAGDSKATVGRPLIYNPGGATDLSATSPENSKKGYACGVGVGERKSADVRWNIDERTATGALSIGEQIKKSFNRGGKKKTSFGEEAEGDPSSYRGQNEVAAQPASAPPKPFTI